MAVRSFTDTLKPSLPQFLFKYPGLQVRAPHHVGPLLAASTMMIVPILIVFFLARKHFVQGMALTGIKA